MKNVKKEKLERNDRIEFSGTVVETLPGTLFHIKVDDSDTIVLATLSGKLRQNKIKILVEDRVKIEVSPYDLTRGRITWRG